MAASPWPLLDTFVQRYDTTTDVVEDEARLLVDLEALSAAMQTSPHLVYSVDRVDLERLADLLDGLTGRTVGLEGVQVLSTPADGAPWKPGGANVVALAGVQCSLVAAVCLLQACNIGFDKADIPVKSEFVTTVVSLLHAVANRIVVPAFNPPELDGEGALSARVLATHQGKLSPLTARLAQAVYHLEDLLRLVLLDDEVVESVVRVVLPAVFLQGGNITLPVSCMKALQTVFQKYPVSRAGMLDDVVAAIGGFPRKRNPKMQHPVWGSSDTIHMLTALVLHLMQSIVEVPTETAIELAAGSAGDGDGRPNALQTALSPMQEFLSRFFGKCARLKDEDSSYQKALRWFVEDLLLVLADPDWPAAEPMLFTLLRNLGVVVRNGSEQTSQDRTQLPMTTLAIHTMGLILSTVQARRKQAREHPLKLTAEPVEVNPDANPTNRGETIGCLCNRGVTGDFMLDCDRCHHWFHGVCVSVTEEAAHTAASWLCDDCQVRKQIELQLARLDEHPATKTPEAVPPPAAGAAKDTPPKPKKSKKSKSGGKGKSRAGKRRKAGEDKPPVPVEADVDVVPPKPATPATNPTGAVDLTDPNMLLVFRQLLLNTTAHRTYDNAFAAVARQFTVARWAHEALQAGNAELCRILAVEATAPSLSGVTADKLPPTLSPAGLDRVCNELTTHTNLFRLFVDHFKLLLRVVTTTRATKLRSDALKAVAEILRVDPDLMSRKVVFDVVTACLQPTVPLSLKAEAAQLTGDYLGSNPPLWSTYFRPLFQLLKDTGTTVRRKIVSIMHHALVSGTLDAHAPKNAVQAVLLQLLRMHSAAGEDEHMKKRIARVFDELWFSGEAAPPPPFASPVPPTTPDTPAFASPGTPVTAGAGAASTPLPPPSATKPGVPPSLTSRALQVVRLVWSQLEAGGGSAASNFQWLADMVARTVYGGADTGDPRDARRGRPLSAADAADDDGLEEEEVEAGSTAPVRVVDRAALKRCGVLVQGVMDRLLDVDRGAGGVEAMQDWVAATVVLRTFALACPQLVARHLGTLIPYLKHRANDCSLKHGDTIIVKAVTATVATILPVASRLTDAQTTEVVADLMWTLSNGVQDVLLPAASCLRVVIKHSPATKKPVFGTLQAAFRILHGTDPFGQAPRLLERALFTSGVIVSQFGFDDGFPAAEFDPEAAALKPGAVAAAAHHQILRFAHPDVPVPIRKKAIQGLCFLLMAAPDLVDDAPTLAAVKAGLSGSPDLALVTLAALRDLCDSQLAARKAGRVKPGSDPLLIGMAVIQMLPAIQPLLLGPEARMRAQGLGLLSSLREQGVLNTQTVVAPLVALTLDPQSAANRTRAWDEIRALHQRYPSVVVSNAVPGILMAHKLQTGALPRDGTYRQLEAMYQACLCASVRSRREFLEAVVERFAPSTKAAAGGGGGAPTAVFSPTGDMDALDSETRAALRRSHSAKQDAYKRVRHLELARRASASDAGAGAGADAGPVVGGDRLDAAALRFLAAVVCALPFTKEEEGLTVVYFVNRRVSLHTPTLDALVASLPSASPVELQRAHNLVWGLQLLLHVKAHLKQCYTLSDARCLSFTPYSGAKANEKSAVLAAAGEELPLVPATEATPGGIAEAVAALQATVADDPCDFDPSAAAAAATAKRAKATTRRRTPGVPRSGKPSSSKPSSSRPSSNKRSNGKAKAPVKKRRKVKKKLALAGGDEDDSDYVA